MSGPGGVGKGTVVRALVARDPSLWLSRSWTSRARRPGEAEDAYRFASRAEFDSEVARGGFLEWAEFLGNAYGTPWPNPPAGTDVVLEIDVQGAVQVIGREPSALLVFLVPPSTEELQRRMEERGDAPDKVAERLAVAAAERDEARKLGAVEIVNDDLEVTLDEVQQQIREARARAAPASGES